MVNPTTNARFKSKKQVTIRADEDDQMEEMSDSIPMSQQSITSSDAGILAAVAQQMQISKEKKTKEQAKKFFKLIDRELGECYLRKSEALSQTVQNITAHYEKFAASYASTEDDIRKLWVRVGEQQISLLNLATRHQALITSNSIELENDLLKGMASVRRACEDFKALEGNLAVRDHV